MDNSNKEGTSEKSHFASTYFNLYYKNFVKSNDETTNTSETSNSTAPPITNYQNISNTQPVSQNINKYPQYYSQYSTNYANNVQYTPNQYQYTPPVYYNPISTILMNQSSVTTPINVTSVFTEPINTKIKKKDGLPKKSRFNQEFATTKSVPSVGDLAKIKFSIPPPPILHSNSNFNQAGKNVQFQIPIKKNVYKSNFNEENKIPKSPPMDNSQKIQGKWTTQMKKYVERCFSLYEDEIDKDALEKHFRSYFTHVFENKLENVIDWEKQTLPNHLMKAEKQDDVHSRLSFLDSTNSELSKKSPKRKKKKVKHAMMILENANSEENLKSIEKRKSRFSIEQKNKGVKSRLNFANRNTNLIQYEPVETVHLKDVRIKGTCTLIDKKYFRLTTLPDPSTVRSENVLCESLEFHKKQWTKEHNYRYTCDQFKSIRQDLTVQGIVNEFSIVVYETHARIALEAGDNAEFNQCQSQLKQLYKTLDSKCRKEFMCYRILYAIFVKNYGDLAEELYNVYKEIIDENLQFSVDFAHAWVIGNYSKLFCLYRNPPHMSSYIIDWFITNEREEAIKKMIKVYRPSLEIDVVQNYLKMDNVDDVVSLCSNIGVEINDGVIDCKYYTNLFTQNN